MSKRKRGVENNTGLYQVPATLSRIVELEGLGAWVLGLLASQPPHVWLLSGPIGAGKTTLIQHLARQLGVTADVTSPTFALQKIHTLRGQLWQHLVHIDAYRIESTHEIAALELDQYIADPETLLVVEWPERLSGFVWGAHLNIALAVAVQGGARTITVQSLR